MATVTAAALAGAAAPTALAADDCPNAAVRAQQQSQHLPNCMAYEKITPAEKSGETPGAMLITEDGNGLTFALNAGIADARSAVLGIFGARRSAAGGWAVNALAPAMDGPVLPALNAGAVAVAGTRDLSRTVLRTTYAVDPNDRGIYNAASFLGTGDMYIRESDGSFRWLVPDPSVPDTSTRHVFFRGASSDLERVVLGTQRPWDARATGSSEVHLYVWTPDGTQLVSVLPNGDLATGLPSGDGSDGVQASADGRRIAFLDRSAAHVRMFVRFNADDPVTASTREVAVGPNGEPCAGMEWNQLKLSADGRQATFTCGDGLPGYLAPGTYIRDLDGGAGAVRLLVNVQASPFATPEFSRVYLMGQASQVWLARDGGAAERVVTPVANGQVTDSRISDDGEYLAFESTADFGLPGVDHSSLNGKQIYLYAARTDTLTCVSCRRDGSPTEGQGTFGVNDMDLNAGGGGAGQRGMRPVSTSGTVTFSSNSALVPEDTNGRPDAYAWVDGRAVLLSNGRSSQVSAAQGGSADGSSFFFRTGGAMVPDDRDGGAIDLYVARVNGGTLLPDPPPAPCTANCQGPGPERPSLPGLGSADFAGRGNLLDTTKESAKRATASLTASRSVKGSSTTVRVKVSRAGTIRVSGVGLRQTTAKAKKAGTHRVTVRLSTYGVKQQRSRGRLATRVTARFTPQSGASVSARKSVTFTAAKKGGR